jgi:hypothetical protein
MIAASPEQQLLDIVAAVAGARAALAEGAFIEFAGLDTAVAEACEAARAASGAERPAALVAMTTLASELDGLAEELARRNAARRQRAADAYGDPAQRPSDAS